MAPRLKAVRLRLVLLDIRIDDAGDVVFVLFDLLEQTVVFFLLGLGYRLLDLLVLGLFDFLVFGFRCHHGFYGLRHARAALLQKHFGFESEGAFGTFDRAFLQVVKTSRAAGADAFGSKIGLVQAGVSRMWSKGRWVWHEPMGLSKSKPGLTRPSIRLGNHGPSVVDLKFLSVGTGWPL